MPVTLSITIPDAVAARVIDAIAATKGYDPASGQTKAQFAKAHLLRYLKDIVIAYEGQTAARTALANAAATAESQITLT